MIGEIKKRIDVLYNDLFHFGKDQYYSLLEDFKVDIVDIVCKDPKEMTIHDKLMTILTRCCHEFGVEPIDVMSSKRLNIPQTRAAVAYVKIASNNFSNMPEICNLVSKTRQYYYYALGKFDDMNTNDEVFKKQFKNISYETGNSETD